MKFNYKQRGIWKNLGLAILCIPIVGLVSSIVIILSGIPYELMAKIWDRGHWWETLIIWYILSVIYVFLWPKFRYSLENYKYASALILYWKAQLHKQDKPYPSKEETKEMRKDLLRRVEICEYSDPKFWSVSFPDEKYSEDPFDIVDGLMKMRQKISKI